MSSRNRFGGTRVEMLERRLLWAASPSMLQPPEGLSFLNRTVIPQFVNDITGVNPLAPGFQYSPDSGSQDHFTVGAYPIVQDLGLGTNPATGSPYLTPLFGYGPTADSATYPGRTFEVQRGAPIAVTWVNGLPTTHLVNIDPTLLDWGMPGMGITYDPATNSIAQGIPMVPHLHGGHTDAVYDGTPQQWWTAGGAMGMDHIDTTLANPTQPPNTFTYRNDQQAATLWYHDHAMGVTRLNAYAGLAGFYVIRDGYDTGRPGNPLGLPAGKYEMALAIQDKQFLSDGRLWFPAMEQEWDEDSSVASTLPEMFGDTILVNGKAWPRMTVEARRYRFHLLNASDSRFYTINLSDSAKRLGASALPIWQIGSDDGLLNAPVKMDQLTLAPGERVDLILDFSKVKPGTRLIMANQAASPFPKGDRVEAGLTDRIMAFDVIGTSEVDESAHPTGITNLNRTDPIPPPQIIAPTREVALYETTDRFGRVTPLLGTPESSAEFMDPITESIQLGATEVWRIYNNTADSHPIHLHQVAFQVLYRQPFSTKLVELGASESGVTHWGMSRTRLKAAPTLAAGNEVAWKDTIQIHPGESIVLRATFDLPGRYVTHCHILSHEEHDMMRYLQVGEEAFPTPEVIVAAAAAPPADSFASTWSSPGITSRLFRDGSPLLYEVLEDPIEDFLA